MHSRIFIMSQVHEVDFNDIPTEDELLDMLPNNEIDLLKALKNLKIDSLYVVASFDYHF